MTDPTTRRESLIEYLTSSQTRYGWHQESWNTGTWKICPPPLLALDTETTGLDTTTDRVVTMSLVVIEATSVENRSFWPTQWILNPGIPISPAATAIHGITDEMASRGQHPVDALGELLDLLALPAVAGLPLVVFNAPFDLGLLRAEESRHLGSSRLLGTINPPILDPMVIDKYVDRFRRGKRTLAAVAEVHQVPSVRKDHCSTADALTAGMVAWSQLLRSPELSRPAPQLHQAQIGWARQQREAFADYRDSQGRAEEAQDIRGRSWPV